MATTIAQVVAQFKADVGAALSAAAIEQVCSDFGHTYRKRILDPVTTGTDIRGREPLFIIIVTALE